MPSVVAESQNDYTIESAVLSSNRTPTGEFSYEISRLITDFEVYEHLDKPYLTGNLMFVDKFGIIQRLDIQGGESFEITIKSSQMPERLSSIVKKFKIGKINNSVKLGDHEDVVSINLVEDIAFDSTVKNINKSFTGTASNIIEQILGTYLNKPIIYPDSTFQSRMKVIVPNMHPLEAATWIKNTSTNKDGLPFYLFSVFGDDSLRFYDLGTLLTAEVMNRRIPYVYLQAVSQTQTMGQYTVVQSYDVRDHDNLLSLIRKGLVGSRNIFYDTFNGVFKDIKFDVGSDVFSMMADNNYFNDNQSRFNFGPDLKIDEQPIGDYNSKVISKISSSNIYKNIGNYKTLEEENSDGGYRKRIIGNALKHFMTKNPITLQVSGRDYIMGEGTKTHYTIGNKIRFLCLDPLTDTGSEPKFDKKKSGDYIIYAAKHKFSVERYDIQLLCTKLASAVEDIEL